MVGIRFVCGTCAYCGGTERMKCSYYNFIIDVDGAHYAYNALSTAIVQIDESVHRALVGNDPNGIPNQYVSDLKNAGFVVDDKADEVAEYSYFFDSIRFGRSAAAVHVTLLPTYGCNLACPYCSQGATKTNGVIDRHNTDVVLKFIEGLCGERTAVVSPTKLIISLFGGEPLLCQTEIAYFLEKCHEIANRHSLPVQFDMTTNFTLCTEETIELIKRHDINVQVSIDGIREDHDQRRVFPNGKGTYDVILGKLKHAYARGVSNNITIRVNTDSETVENANRIFNELHQYAGYVYFSFLTSYKGINDSYNKCIEPNCYANIMANTFNPIYERSGVGKMWMFGKKAPCAMVCEKKYWVDLNLDVYNCELLVNHPEAKAGHLTEDGVLEFAAAHVSQMYCVPLMNAKCRVCKLLPVCGGGCPAKKYLDSTDKVISCECSTSESALREALTIYIREKVKS